MRGLVAALAAAGLAAWGAREAAACDVCAVYTIEEMGRLRTGPWLAVAEQYAHLGTLMDDGEKVANPADQYLNSSVTQFAGGYWFLPEVGAQVVLPVIHRSWRRPWDGGIQQDSRPGIGDMALLGIFSPWSTQGERGLFRTQLEAGFSVPTGDAAFLGEESEEVEPEEPMGRRGSIEGSRFRDRVSHGGEDHDASGIHGHDLAFGTGSVSGILGAEVFGSFDRWFSRARGQWILPRSGAFDYQYADQLLWRLDAGMYLMIDNGEAWTTALSASFSGGTKGQDESHGVALDDTALTYLFLGPRIAVSWTSHLVMDVGVDVPVRRVETALQVVPDWRVRAGVSWNF